MTLTDQIKEFALSLGFDACGICKAEEVDEVNRQSFNNWVDHSFHADMDYMTRNTEKRFYPTLLVEGSKSIISVALNYYPQIKQPAEYPQFAYYAYGKDYHDVVKGKLLELYDYIRSLEPRVEGRAFVDTAPILERYWAARAGIGFIGKNSLLIIPKKGSFFFLGELIINLELEYDTPLNLSCGNCTRCMEACPTRAITSPRTIDSYRCLSYQTIENKKEIAKDLIPLLNNRYYGCDICQQVCPWNRYSQPHKTKEFNPSDAFLDLSFDKLDELTEEEYRTIFKGSAVKRAKYWGLKRNLEAIRSSKEL